MKIKIKILSTAYNITGKVFNQDERIVRRLPYCFPSFHSASVEFANQALRVLKSQKSYGIQGIVIEPTNHCNLRCGHCSARLQTHEPKGYIDIDFYKDIIDSNPQLTCLLLARNGEPFLHPKIFELIRYAKDRGLYILTYTNGSLLNEKKIDSILSSGLDEIYFSMEGVGDDYEYNRGVSYAKLKNNIQYLLDKRNSEKHNLKVYINATKIDNNYDTKLTGITNEWGDKVDHIDIEPLMLKKSAQRKNSCRTLWRNAVITWDGEVLPCCLDMGRRLSMGNLREKSLVEIFNGDNAKSIRRMHILGDYPKVCKYCNEFFG